MRRSKWIAPAFGVLRLATAQEECPATVTITDLASAPNTPVSSGTAATFSPGSSSLSRQVITLTQVNTVIMTSNGVKIEKTQAVTNVLLVDDRHTASATPSGGTNKRQATSCPPAVTVTLVSQQTGSTVGPTTTSSSTPLQTGPSITSQISSTSSQNTSTPSQTGPSTTPQISSTSNRNTSTSTSTLSSTQATSKSITSSTTSLSTSGVNSTATTQASAVSSSTTANITTSNLSSFSSSSSSISKTSSTRRLTTSSANTSSRLGSSSSSATSQTKSESLASTSSSHSNSQSSSLHGIKSTSSASTSVPIITAPTSTKSETSSSKPAFSSTSLGPGFTSGSSKAPSPPSSSPVPSGSTVPPTGSSTAPPSSTFQSVTVLSEIDPGLWKSPSPTVTCKVPCNLDLPCLTLDKPTVVTPPPYTTSLCKQHCDGIDFRTITTISFPPITTSKVCFYPMQAEEADVFTAAPNWFGGQGGLINITAPASLSTCPPHWPETDADGKCGPENHYLCPKKKCCGKDNKCGEGLDYCGEGCQLNWGYCWKNSTTCKMPLFGMDDDDDHAVPIFPIWFDAPDPPGPPPPLTIRSGGITFPPPPDPCDILGCESDCGWISCEGIAGWFIKMIRIPKLKCNLITKTFCRLLKLPCCKKKGGDDDNSECELCDPPDGSMLNGEGKVCDPNMENCDDLPKEEEEHECTKTSSATDRTVFCAMKTAADGKSSQTCTSTASKVRSGCTIKPESTKTVTSTGCQTTTVDHVSELCQVITGASTTRTECPSTITKQASGCEVSPTRTSVFTTSCDEITATHISELCSVATGANSTSTYCGSTRSGMVSGCDVTGSATSVFSTDCFSRTTVTDKTASCFALGSTVIAGSTIIPSTTCTATASTVWSGCELTGSTTSIVSTSFPACAASAQITLEPMPTFASNLTDSTATGCGPPTSSGLPQCTKIVAGQYVVTEAMGEISGSGITARDGGTSSTANLSCYCGPSASADVWPVTVCDGKSTWCPNEATTTREQTGTPAPPTLPVAPS